MTEAQLQKLEQLEKAAAPGKWKVIQEDIHGHRIWMMVSSEIGFFGLQGPSYDAEFIAEMRNALPELLKTIRDQDRWLRYGSAGPAGMDEAFHSAKLAEETGR